MPTPVLIGPVETFAANSGASHVFAKPAALADGDVLVATLRAQGTDWPTDWGLPSGWSRLTAAYPGAGPDRVHGIYAHTVTTAASEPSSYTFTAAMSTARRVGALWIVRGAQGFSGASPTYAGTTITGGKRAESYALTNANSEPYLTLFFGGSEFGAGASHVPTSKPTGYTENYQYPDPAASTSVSRTGVWVGSVETPASPVGAASITWAVAAGPDAQSVSFQGSASPVDPRGEGIPVHLGDQSSARLFLQQTAGIRTPTQIANIWPGWFTVTEMLAKPGFTWAHRGGSLSWPEHSLHAYTQSALRGYGGLEISLARTSDGVWFGLHDADINRTSGTTGLPAASTMTWAEIQAYQITIGPGGPQPYMTFDQLIAAYGHTHILICDAKTSIYNSTLRAEFLAKCSADIGTDRCIVKAYYDDPTIAVAASNAGFQSWGYTYESNMGDANWFTDMAPWTIVGLDIPAAQASWDTVIGLGKPVVGHIAASQAAYDSAIAKGADGVQCSATAAITAVT